MSKICVARAKWKVEIFLLKPEASEVQRSEDLADCIRHNLPIRWPKWKTEIIVADALPIEYKKIIANNNL